MKISKVSLKNFGFCGPIGTFFLGHPVVSLSETILIVTLLERAVANYCYLSFDIRCLQQLKWPNIRSKKSIPKLSLDW